MQKLNLRGTCDARSTFSKTGLGNSKSMDVGGLDSLCKKVLLESTYVFFVAGA
jgi:hypothetical protein